LQRLAFYDSVLKHCRWHRIILPLHELSDRPMRDLYAETSAIKGILWRPLP